MDAQPEVELKRLIRHFTRSLVLFDDFDIEFDLDRTLEVLDALDLQLAAIQQKEII